MPSQKKVMLCIGRLEKIKGFDLAIKTIGCLSDEYHLVIVGEGSQKSYLKNLATDMNVDYKVQFERFTKKPEDYYQASDYFLMTSTYEPLGQVILEALASGINVVAPKSTDSIKTATSEIAERLNAPILLCETYDPIALAQLIEINSDSPGPNFSKCQLSWMSLYDDLKRNL
ncbi:hypothetical protein ABA45_11750 [Marinobacter psychrophilus]|uniref:Glycosyl transferase family 1 domain-containing protein n=2 Tax=Marinobacter psychrophilus TaxID=330734 RepID=A0A0H4IDB1_9GAMM|nr:hypothetical protein ABA45_11750 [Marinobacter psychrophilus]